MIAARPEQGFWFEGDEWDGAPLAETVEEPAFDEPTADESAPEATEVLADETVVDEVPVGHAPSPERYGAVVLGSAVYAGSWRDEARQWATRHAGAATSSADPAGIGADDAPDEGGVVVVLHHIPPPRPQ